MHNYGLPTEDVRLALALGVLLSILAYERWRLTGGAAVVAGYLGMFINRPLYVVTTVFLSIVTYYLVQNFIARRMFLYGRCRLMVMVLVGMAFQFVTGLISLFRQRRCAVAGGFIWCGLCVARLDRAGYGAPGRAADCPDGSELAS